MDFTFPMLQAKWLSLGKTLYFEKTARMLGQQGRGARACAYGTVAATGL